MEVCLQRGCSRHVSRKTEVWLSWIEAFLSGPLGMNLTGWLVILWDFFFLNVVNELNVVHTLINLIP